MALGDTQDRENAEEAVRTMAEAAVRQHMAAQVAIMQSLGGFGCDPATLIGECSVDDAAGEFRTTILGPMPGHGEQLVELAVVVTRTEGLVAPAVVVANNQKGVVRHAAHDRGT